MNNDTLNTLTFIKLWEEYSNYKKVKLKPQSYRKIENNFKNHILPYFNDYLIKDINSKVYIDWMSKINEEGHSFAFKSSLHYCINNILEYAIKFYGLNINIASMIGNFNKNTNRPKNIDFWTIDEFNKFMSMIDDENDYLLFRALYFTGMRIGEAIALTWHDFDGSHLHINKTMAKEKDKNGNYIITSPKTLSSNRFIELDKKTIQLIQKKYSKDCKKIGFDNNWYIFRNSKPLTQTTVSRKKNNYCELSGVKKIRLHDFRHSHATFLLSHGIPVTVIAQRLGQSDLTVTLNTYIHLVPNDEIRAINLIDSFN